MNTQKSKPNIKKWIFLYSATIAASIFIVLSFQSKPRTNKLPPGIWGTRTSIGEKYDNARRELIKLAKELKIIESSFPFLASKRSFPLIEPPKFKTFEFLDSMKKEELIDPWNNSYFYDGVNGLLYSAGPNGIFIHEQPNKGNDDIIVSIIPMFYVKSVYFNNVERNSCLLIFSQKLKNQDVNKESVVIKEHKQGEATQRILIRRTRIDDWYPDGWVHLFFDRKISPNSKITCSFTASFQAQSGTELSFSRKSVYFEDLTYGFLQTKQHSSLKNYNVKKISHQDIDFVSYDVEDFSWFQKEQKAN